ncbi:hypothetical protein H257_12733 [Aphanomyces astaci]|uniref:Uncharacterized protein n=1 Tax=Aphanomyces astaci TaxID=112090 RepID=W4FXQ6_APHAT|nr:hypothetical protein H257_12733 [Aphanomyces astaci]ETV72272.1 hypothetical protein H257_12733 [Aphanomyces astaci]|eukprot:XP_009838340.1 hypothetical protein H257_12733 [Aphanomyces astaci]
MTNVGRVCKLRSYSERSSHMSSTCSSPHTRSMTLSCSDAQKQVLQQLASPQHSDIGMCEKPTSSMDMWQIGHDDEFSVVMHDLKRTLDQFEAENMLPKALERLAWATTI